VPPNPHPVGYHALLAQIALEHQQSGGADINAEVARRFLEAGGISGEGPEDMPPDPFQGPPQEFTETPAQVTARDAATRASGQVMSGEPGAQPVPGSYDQANPDSQAANYDQGHRLAREQDVPPPAEQPTVDVQPVKSAAPEQKSVSRGTGTARTPAEPSDTERQIQAGTDERTQGAEDVADVAQQRAAVEGPQQQDIANQQQALVDRNNTVQQFAQENQKRLLQKQEMLVDQYANGTVDTKRLWNNMDTGHKILAGLSLMLSGNGDGSPVMRAINQDVESQKDAIERKKGAAGMVGNLFNEYSKMGLDSTNAMERAVLTAKEVGLQRAAATAAQFKGPEAKAAVLGIIGNNTIDGAQHVQANRESISRISLQKAQAAEAYQNAQTGAYNLGQAKKFGNYVEGQTGVAGAPPGGLVQDAQGNTGVSLRGEEGAKNYIAETTPAQKILQSIANIDAQRKSGTVTDKAALKSEAEALKSSVLELNGLKDNPKAAQMADALVGDPAETFSNPISGGWEQKRAALLQMANQTLDQSAARNQIQFNKQPKVLQRPVLNPIGKKKHG
jgi:hypothetical protein